LVFVPFAAAFYMFVWPSLARAIEGVEFAGMRAHCRTDDFWATFPGPGIAVLTLLVDGFLIIYLMGAKGFCTYGCPYGAVFGLVDRAAKGRIRVTDACEGCGHCSAVCTSNVLVHLEVARFGQVVDSGCMKCMDCVSVCPKDALYFGFGESRGTALKRKGAVQGTRRVYDFSAREEAALAVLFLASLFALRGLYDLVPFLLAIGLAVITALLSVLSWRVLRSPRVMFQGRALVEAGRRNALGITLLAGCALWWMFLGHSGWVQSHATRGRGLLLDAIAMPSAQRSATLAASLGHLDLAAKWGLLPVAQLEFMRGQILARQGEREAARERLNFALRLNPKLHLAALELAELALGESPPDLAAAQAQLERVLEQAPQYVLARERLAALEFRAAQAARLRGDLQLCENHLRRSLELAPNLIPAHLDLSDLAMSKSPPDLAAARAALRGLLSVDPTNAEAQRRLQLLEARFGAEQ
jgi:ferredoxin